jgi:hypothetical protein
MGYVVYALTKFAAYAAWCGVGLVLVPDGTATAAAAARFGLVRWCIGLAFGVVIFFVVGSISADAAARTYVTVYSPVRAVEWGIMAFVIRGGGSRPMTPGRAALWCFGGILVSFASDLLSPDGLAGRFCVGRCLC